MAEWTYGPGQRALMAKDRDGWQRGVTERGGRPSEWVGILACQPLPGLFPTLGLFPARIFLY